MGDRGFSLLEVVAATALTLTIMAVVFALVEPARASFAAQPEAADMQQRLRVAAGTLYKDLVMAGAGTYQGANTGSLGYYFAPVLPYRWGTTHDDPAGSFKADTITLMYVPPTVAQTTLAAGGPGAVGADIDVNIGPGCPSDDPACGFKNGMTALIYDAAGTYDTFTVLTTQSNVLHVERTGGRLTRSSYPRDTTTIAQLTNVIYYLKSNVTAGTYQLMSRDGATGADVPVVDHLVSLRFEYFGDPLPPVLTGKALSDPIGPWTTYGPPPPALDQQIPTGGYPTGENCTFAVDPVSGAHVPRLEVLDSTDALVPLTPARLTDGPWCPDAMNANRWDADLLRIRKIAVTLRVEAADAAMRGPVSVLFARGGTSKSGSRWLPDLQMTLQVAPRNLAFGR